MRHNKLVRDKIPEICKQNGQIPKTRTLSDDEYRVALDDKLREEVAEYTESDDLEELADILEVIHSIARQKGSTQDELEELRQEKASKRGGFTNRIFLIETKDKN